MRQDSKRERACKVVATVPHPMYHGISHDIMMMKIKCNVSRDRHLLKKLVEKLKIQGLKRRACDSHIGTQGLIITGEIRVEKRD